MENALPLRSCDLLTSQMINDDIRHRRRLCRPAEVWCDGAAFFDDSFNRIANALRGFDLAQALEQHRATQDHRRRIDFILPDQVQRGAVRGLKDRYVVAET